MSRLSKYKHFIVGCVVGSMLVSGVAVAANDSLTNVLKGTSKFIINQVDKTPANNVFYNGSKNVPSSLIYEGTTYIPIRMVSNMLNIPINWDGKNNAVLVGTSVYNGEYLTDMAPSKVSSRAYINSKTNTNYYKIDGQEYNRTIAFDAGARDRTGSISYNLNGKYETLSFIYGGTTSSYNGELSIYSEDELIWTGISMKGIKGQEVTIDVKGLMSIDIHYTSTNGYNYDYSNVVIANPFLSKKN